MQNQKLNNLFKYLAQNAVTIITVSLILLVYNAWAAPGNSPSATPATEGSLPGVISYQGTLTDKVGQPVNGNTNMTFKIYNLPTGGTALWSEAHVGVNAVPISNGLFNVLLGSLTPIPASVWNSNQLFLGIKVGNDLEMTPREVIGDVPLALQAKTALTVPDRAIKSRHVQLSNGQVVASSSIDLTSISQPVPGISTTLTPETNQTYLVYVTADIEMEDEGLALLELLVDGVSQPNQVIFGGSGTRERGTVSQTYPINLSPSTHTLVLKGKLYSGTGAKVWTKHTTMTYLAVSQ